MQVWESESGNYQWGLNLRGNKNMKYKQEKGEDKMRVRKRGSGKLR
jgi:hypothetical protein